MCARVSLSLQKEQNVRDEGELHQVNTFAHGSVKESPTNIASGSWDQHGIQTDPPRHLTLCRWYKVPPLGIGAGHEGDKVKGMEH